MLPSEHMRIDPEAWGVSPGYHDIGGTWREAPQSTVRAVLETMDATGPIPPAGVPVWTVRTNEEAVHLGGRWELHGENGEYERVSGTMPVPPPGYYDLLNENDGRRVRLIVAPPACHLPPDLRTWGWAVQLYALRSRQSWGIGDFADLRRLGEWSSDHGARIVLVNPLHAPTPVAPVEPSPYFPSSRCFYSPLYLRVEEVPGADELGDDLQRAAAVGHALNDKREIDRDEVWRIKSEVLERLHARFTGAPEFDDFCETAGRLREFATFCALAEWYGPDWREWPEDYQHPDSPDVTRYADSVADRVHFHMWLQWHLDRQLAAAGTRAGLVQDLAIGVDPAGADAWLWQDHLAFDMNVGAPPDAFNTQGQDWDFPPFDPWRLRASQFEPFIQTVRAGLRHAGGLRFDHVMGLFRQFWIPRKARPAAGVYVQYPWEELLHILALESYRAGAWIVGEDLGTVEPFVREELASRDVLSYRLLWFEEEPPARYPEHALAAITTHDLPTVGGLWNGTDVERQKSLGVRPNVEGMARLRERLGELAGVGDDAPVEDVTVGAYQRLAEAPSMVVAATIEDPLGVEERPNYPGTLVDTNWSVALPVPLEEIETDPTVDRVAAALNERHQAP